MRIVVKIGSALLVDQQLGLRRRWLESLIDDVAELKDKGTDVLVVSSGAVALGRLALGLLGRKSLTLAQMQAAAAVGQIQLSQTWAELLSAAGLQAGQVLLTGQDTEDRRRYLNARATISELLQFGSVPIVNENDTVANDEIRFGDNDRLAARVATMMSADLLVLLSNVDGLYRRWPRESPDDLVEDIESITPKIEAMAKGADSLYSRGGMISKLQAAKIATESGTELVITSGIEKSPLAALAAGGKATWFRSTAEPLNARKKWIAGGLMIKGTVRIDDGAVAALRRGNSLLMAGVRRVEGDFQRGDSITICDQAGQSIGCGLSTYDSEDARAIAGRNSEEFESVIGYFGPAELIHRDDMAVAGDFRKANGNDKQELAD